MTRDSEPDDFYEEEYDDDNYDEVDPEDEDPITRYTYDSENPDPFEVPDLASVEQSCFIRKENAKCGILKIDPKKILEKIHIFEVENLVVDPEVILVGKQKVRGVRRGRSPKTPNKR